MGAFQADSFDAAMAKQAELLELLVERAEIDAANGTAQPETAMLVSYVGARLYDLLAYRKGDRDLDALCGRLLRALRALNGKGGAELAVGHGTMAAFMASFAADARAREALYAEAVAAYTVGEEMYLEEGRSADEQQALLDCLFLTAFSRDAAATADALLAGRRLEEAARRAAALEARTVPAGGSAQEISVAMQRGMALTAYYLAQAKTSRSPASRDEWLGKVSALQEEMAGKELPGAPNHFALAEAEAVRGDAGACLKHLRDITINLPPAYPSPAFYARFSVYIALVADDPGIAEYLAAEAR